MKKQTIIILTVVILALVVIFAVVFMNKGNKTNLKPIESAEDLSALIKELYVGKEETLPPSVNTTIVDVTDANEVKSATGLENGDNLQFLAVSEPMISSQAYSLVLAKVKDGVDANEVAKEMSEKINPAKWICVSAEKIYSTNSGDVVCLVMASEEWAKPVYESFKTLAGTVGKEYEKTGSDFSANPSDLGEPIVQ